MPKWSCHIKCQVTSNILHQIFLMFVHIVFRFNRQACAVESAARWHRDRNVYILFASQCGVYKNGTTPLLFQMLNRYPNIHFRTMNLWRFSYGTPLYEWMKTNQIFQSKYIVEHIADIFRFCTLYKFGGLYLDLDIIVLGNLDVLGEDYVGDDWYEVANNAVIHVNTYGIGREVMERCLRYIRMVFLHCSRFFYVCNLYFLCAQSFFSQQFPFSEVSSKISFQTIIPQTGRL